MEERIVKYEDIEKVNQTLKTIDVKGKQYAEVNQRIKAFRMLYPQGAITTEMLSNENGVCVFRAVVTTENGLVLGTGTAYEKEDSTFINKTSYIENCETSAVGRALGMAGFGIDTSIATAEEVATAIINQDGNTLINDTKAKILYKALVNKLGDNQSVIKYLTEKYKVDNTSQITNMQYAEICREMK